MHVWTTRRVTTRRWPDEHGEVRAVVESMRVKLGEGGPMHEALPAGESNALCAILDESAVIAVPVRV